ncbi:hypothetical protein [Streptomyces canus]|uniref:hypothetical protein n=1 Tax=Streptomyces TaxID=1883 RepID=UPI0036E4B416
MTTTDVERARRWSWALTATAVLAMGTLPHGLRSPPGPATGILVRVSTLVMAASAVQAARTRRAGRPAPTPAVAPHHRLSARQPFRSHLLKEE